MRQPRKSQASLTRRQASTVSMVDQVGRAIATADSSDFESDAAHYRRLARAALKPLTRPTEAMVNAAHEAGAVRCVLGDQQSSRLQEGGAGDDLRGDGELMGGYSPNGHPFPDVPKRVAPTPFWKPVGATTQGRVEGGASLHRHRFTMVSTAPGAHGRLG